ncbi:hypothetical protein AVEN_206268-1 [Araneus ventricosus]|uniref:PiggyBac transposable element-derived protein domain-containing protein n=1 Tax=Araneus ventricosus TaxID=182803 RepID=A0A4Y2M636_ARAVE|nr:hypothetical protein AVEN_206268-1 [Araneus ventricosus]
MDIPHPYTFVKFILKKKLQEDWQIYDVAYETVSRNRIRGFVPCVGTKRGDFETRTSVSENITVVRWVDNSAVTVASNCHGHFQLTKFQNSSTSGSE